MIAGIHYKNVHACPSCGGMVICGATASNSDRCVCLCRRYDEPYRSETSDRDPTEDDPPPPLTPPEDRRKWAVYQPVTLRGQREAHRQVARKKRRF